MNNEILSPDEAWRHAVCPKCGMLDLSTSVTEIVSVEEISPAAGGAGWNVEGGVKLRQCYHGLCGNCGITFEIASRDIPVRYPSLTCPTCGSSSYMKCEVTKGKYTPDSFEFTAVIECSECGKRARKKITQIISEFWRVTKIKISFNGVEVEKDS